MKFKIQFTFFNNVQISFCPFKNSTLHLKMPFDFQKICQSCLVPYFFHYYAYFPRGNDTKEVSNFIAASSRSDIDD